MKEEFNYSSDPLIKDIQERLHKHNKNWLCLMVGQTGTGKSYNAMALADAIDPDFTIAKVIPRPLDFADGVVNYTFKRGAVIVLDEIGVAMNARRSSDDLNVALSNIFQTFRRWNIGVIYTVPSGLMVDKNVRRLIHDYVVTDYIDEKKKLCAVRWYRVKNDPITDKIFLQKPRYEIKDGIPAIVNSIFIPIPRKKLCDDYEVLDKKFKHEVALKAREKLEKIFKRG